MRFWNALIGEPLPGRVQTDINLHKYNSKQIIEFLEDKIITREEVIKSGVIEAMFGDELTDYIYPRKAYNNEVTNILQYNKTS